jgi:hypothetical protein
MMNEMKKILQIFVIALSIFTFSGCEKEEVAVEYKYEVTGTSGDYSVTIQNTDNNTQQYSNVGNGWWYKWTQTGTRWLYLSAQNNSSTGNVTVRIYRAGKVVAENTSYGGYTIATVDGDY